MLYRSLFSLASALTIVVGCASFSETPADADAGVGDGATPVPEGGGASGPARVTCAAATCVAPAFCCVRADQIVGCETDEAKCAGADDLRVRCDGKGDCPGQVCCMQFSDKFNVEAVTCRADCVGPNDQRACDIEKDECDGARCGSIHDVLSGRPYPRVEMNVCQR